jgi:hypothetical protein
VVQETSQQISPCPRSLQLLLLKQNRNWLFLPQNNPLLSKRPFSRLNKNQNRDLPRLNPQFQNNPS